MLPKGSTIKYVVEITDEAGNSIQWSKTETVSGVDLLADLLSSGLNEVSLTSARIPRALGAEFARGRWSGKVLGLADAFLDEDGDEVEDALSCIVTLSEDELDLVEAAIGNGYISERWVQKHFRFAISEIRRMIEHLLKLGIVKKASPTIYKFMFSYDIFKKARTRL